jgi:protein-S-isoprenylcysteine O-methyltransferase Ste14
VRPPPFEAVVYVAFGLLLNLVVLLVPALLIGQLSLDADVSLFLLGASALCLADLAGIEARRPSAPVGTRDACVDRLAWAQGLAVLAVLWAGLAQRLVNGAEFVFDAGFRALGVACMGAGALLRGAAVRTLGAHFISEIRAGPELVRRGVYCRLRHPAETGLLLAAAGAGLVLSSSVSIAVFLAVLMPISLIRTLLEERVLATAFGAEHASYVREAGRFLPALGAGASAARRSRRLTPSGTLS